LTPKSYILSKFPDKHPNSSGKLHTRCPFHDDRHPSFSIDVDRGLFVCGSSKCGVHGNFFLFYKLMEGLTSWSAVYKALRDSHTELDIDKLLGIESDFKRSDVVNAWPSPSFLSPLTTCDYLEQRQLGPDVIAQFGLQQGKFGLCDGVQLSDSIVVPIFEIDGTYKTFQVRYLNHLKKQRWQFPAHSPVQNILYGGWIINNRTPDLWIVEGASDVWKLFTYGVQSVGLFTKEATSAQYNKLFYLCTLYGLRPIVCLDGDLQISKKYKKDFVKKLKCELEAFDLKPSVVQLEETEDPGSLSKERFLEINATLGECA
jgi:DNA primase